MVRSPSAPRRLLFMLPLAAALRALAQPKVEFGASREPLAVPTLPLSDAPPPRELAQGAEVYLVSGYEPGTPRTAVRIDRPGKRVLLVLTSYDKVFWQVLPTPGTELAGVLVASYSAQGALQAPPGTPAFGVKLPYAYEVDNANFRQLLAGLNTAFGVERIDGVRGAYTLAAENEFRQPDPPRAPLTLAGEQPEAPRRNFGFTLLARDLRPVRWTLTGPVEGGGPYLGEGKVALSPDGERIWRLRGDGLEALRRGETAARAIPLPPDFPSFSWAMDLALDPQLGVLTIVTLGGEGFLYRYDTRNERWLDVRSLNNIDINALAFDPVGHRYVAWTSEGSLLLISRKGEALGQHKLLPLLRGYGALYDRGNAQPPRLTLAPHGEQLALVAIAGGRVTQVWAYDWQRQEARMTWKAGH
ncbi:hypothetical protein HHL11_23780 [Ramlibacter sp. G-1-2-2]|uniref:Uncharacterized protein n=1 Tax=Ramlibacter agri TaxID=2728837 RepID=A0A848H7L8_9BURK|nr:hypothetical protein [Ramlibacter agri]NML46785.1 hypothetical protein [Ramlibacter agri]